MERDGRVVGEDGAAPPGGVSFKIIAVDIGIAEGFGQGNEELSGRKGPKPITGAAVDFFHHEADLEPTGVFAPVADLTTGALN